MQGAARPICPTRAVMTACLPNPSERRFAPEGSLGRRVDFRDRRALEEAMFSGVILEGSCLMCDCTTMRLTVGMGGGLRGVIPREEACFAPDGGEIKDIAVITRVGKPVQFKILSLGENERGEITAVCSRRAAQEECWREYVSKLAPGDIIPARVTHLEPFGAFCDVGAGLMSLLTVDRVSVSRVSHPSDRFVPGEQIRAVVSAVTDGGRIYLSHRELLGTWAENAALFSPGQTVAGIVRSTEDYGVFVELMPNLAGLAEVTEGALPGHSCSVYIKSILPERMKVKLVIVDMGPPAGIAPCRYFIDGETTRHLDRWLYSPPGAKKTVETVFCGDAAD